MKAEVLSEKREERKWEIRFFPHEDKVDRSRASVHGRPTHRWQGVPLTSALSSFLSAATSRRVAGNVGVQHHEPNPEEAGVYAVIGSDALEVDIR